METTRPPTGAVASRSHWSVGGVGGGRSGPRVEAGGRGAQCSRMIPQPGVAGRGQTGPYGRAAPSGSCPPRDVQGLGARGPEEASRGGRPIRVVPDVKGPTCRRPGSEPAPDPAARRGGGRVPSRSTALLSRFLGLTQRRVKATRHGRTWPGTARS